MGLGRVEPNNEGADGAAVEDTTEVYELAIILGTVRQMFNEEAISNAHRRERLDDSRGRG